MLKKLLNGEISHKKLFAIVFWALDFLMVSTAFICAIFFELKDIVSLEKIILLVTSIAITLSGWSYISTQKIYGEEKK